ncbi:hypothetical protein ABQX22_06440 [Xanthomonas sp. WHRI 1810A]|uniref:hypothetical protein n=1 Tax=Xanthomonas sp. WHRI 1810A TaxID=3161565 RepID=UPI0032E8CA05
MAKPYTFINPKLQAYDLLRDSLVSDAHARVKFDLLNGHLRRQLVLPGQLVVIGDASIRSRTGEERHLMTYAGDVRHSIVSSGHSANRVMAQNFDVLQSIMSYGSIGAGSVTGAWSKHLDGIKDTLKHIELLHKSWRSGALTKDQFIAQRRSYFLKLDTQLQGFGRLGSGLNNDRGVKNMLGISSKRYLHSGQIAGYANTVRNVSKMANVLSKGTYVGIGLDVGAGALEIQEACSVGREEQCTKAKYVEGGKMAVGIPVSMLGGWIGGSGAAGICVAAGVPTGGLGTLVCAIIGGAAGAWGAGTFGSEVGGQTGTFIYEVGK